MPPRLPAMMIGLAVLLLPAQPALADVIDGNWCHPDGRRIVIQGSSVVTPAGTRMQGEYSRHFFTYLAPPNEPDAGQAIAMTLVNEMTVHLRRGAEASNGAPNGEYEVWRRCGPPVSMAPERGNERRTTNG